MNVLDEVMENVNMWVKALPLGGNKKSWKVYSPNVMTARRCMLFEKNEYKRGLINFEKLEKDGTYEEHKYNNSTYVEHRKRVEKKRVFEFFMKYVGDEKPDRQSNPKEMFGTIANLETPLNNDSPQDDDYDHYLDLVIEDINNLLDKNQNDDNCDSRSNSSESIHSDNSNVSKENNNSLHVPVAKHHKLAMMNVMELGRQEIQKRNFNQIRLMKKLK